MEQGRDAVGLVVLPLFEGGRRENGKGSNRRG